MDEFVVILGQDGIEESTVHDDESSEELEGVEIGETFLLDMAFVDTRVSDRCTGPGAMNPLDRGAMDEFPTMDETRWSRG